MQLFLSEARGKSGVGMKHRYLRSQLSNCFSPPPLIIIKTRFVLKRSCLLLSHTLQLQITGILHAVSRCRIDLSGARGQLFTLGPSRPIRYCCILAAKSSRLYFVSDWLMHDYTPLKCKNEYLVLALGEETAAQPVVVSIVWAFRRLKKPRCRAPDERPRLRAS